jgi:cyd operon protein YbgT
MWYFAWILGIGFAVLLAILNAMWHEAQVDRETIANGRHASEQSGKQPAA